jgi:hypothetical protein
MIRFGAERAGPCPSAPHEQTDGGRDGHLRAAVVGGPAAMVALATALVAALRRIARARRAPLMVGEVPADPQEVRA